MTEVTLLHAANLMSTAAKKGAQHAAPVDRHDAYRRGLCVDCFTAPHSAGRPRCDTCHNIHASGGSSRTPSKAPAGGPDAGATEKGSTMNIADLEVTPAASETRGTYIHALAVEELFVDGSYQRTPDMPRARKLAAGWDRKLAGVIEVSDREPDQQPRYAVIDGQHRWRAAQLLSAAPMMVATIHEGLSVAEEAALFDRLNRERRRPSTWDHWRARKSAGDATVLAIEQVVAQLGQERDTDLRIDNVPREGNVRCTATLEKLAALGGVELVRDSLELVIDVWDTRQDGFDAPVVGGIGLVLHYLEERIDMERLTDTLLGVMPLQLKTQAAAMVTGGTQPVRMAITIMSLYNRNRRVAGRRIEVSARTFGGGARNARSLPVIQESA